MKSLCVLLLCSTYILGQSRTLKEAPPNPAHAGGPAIDSKRKLGVTPQIVLHNMFEAIEKGWFPSAYGQAKFLEYRAELNATLPPKSLLGRSQRLAGLDSPPPEPNGSFALNLDGVAAPNGHYRVMLRGDLGDLEITNDQKRTLVVSENFKAFSDSPKRGRSASANLSNWRSYLLSHLAKVKHQILESGAYRTFYKGSGTYQGQQVDMVRVFKPVGKLRLNQKQPISMQKLWTFWQDGAYEIWVFKVSKLPAAVFYSNSSDNIFANFTIDYNKDWLPQRFNYRNNSIDQEGSGDLVFTYDSQRMLSGISLKYEGLRGVSLQFDTILSFSDTTPNQAFRMIPPFGFRKMNRDHLKLMVLTQVSGGLLKLKKHGVNLRNFKF